MRRLLALGLLLPSIALAGAPETPICARDEVVAHVAREVRHAAPYASLLPPTIAERPGPAPDVVLCAITILKQDFDTTKYWTSSWSETQYYAVRWLHAGYEVTMGDTSGRTPR
jgi:hypothetical protein